MVSWGTGAGSVRSAPDLAAFGRDRLKGKRGVPGDGPPRRLTVCTPDGGVVGARRVFVGMWPPRRKVRDLECDPQYALHSLMDNLMAPAGSSLSPAAQRGSTTPTLIATASAATNRFAAAGAKLTRTARPVMGKTAERSIERSVKRSRERSPERSSPLDPHPRESAGERPCRVERLLVRLATLRLHACAASLKHAISSPLRVSLPAVE
jgi:hypothetical protein